MIFQLSYERFLEEIRFEKIDQDSKNKIELEDLGDMLAYYLIPLERRQSFVFVVSKKEMTSVQKVNLNPISKPSRRILESTELKNISETLNRIEENLNKLPKGTIIEREVIKE